MRRDLVEMVDEYRLVTPDKREEWRRWATTNTEFDGEQDEKEFCHLLDRIDAGEEDRNPAAWESDPPVGGVQ